MKNKCDGAERDFVSSVFSSRAIRASGSPFSVIDTIRDFRSGGARRGTIRWFRQPFGGVGNEQDSALYAALHLQRGTTH